MSSRFNYQTADVIKMAEHLVTLHRQAYFRAVDYYKEKGDEQVLAKLAQANKLAKILKMQADYDAEYDNA